MTFSQIIFKIFKANIRKYLMFFLCSSFAIMVFFSYSSVYTNEALLNSPRINSSITSMLIAPNLALIIFSLIFILYAHSSFNKFRKTDYGLFMVLGMADKHIRRIILIENSLIAFLSLVTGLLSGSLFSRFVYSIVIGILDIKGIPFCMNLKSYLYTIGLFVAIYTIVILYSYIASYKYRIITLLKEFRTSDRSFLSKPIFGIMGILIICISVMDMVINYIPGDSNVLSRSILLLIIGFYLAVSNLVWFISILFRALSQKHHKNMLLLANLKYSIGQSKKILFLVTLLICITIFFSSISFILISDARRVAIGYNTFDMAYVEFYGKNIISSDMLNNISQTSKTPITKMKSIEFIGENTITILSEDIINAAMKTDFHVERGRFISLFLIMKDDGYKHEISAMRDFNFNVKGINNKYISSGVVTKVIFNKTNLLQDTKYVILDNRDYLEIKSSSNMENIGHIKFLNFKNWYYSKNIVDKISTELENYNKAYSKKIFATVKDDLYMFKPASKIGEYSERRQVAAFLLFLFSFVGLLFFISSGVILHFKLLNEFDREKIKYRKMYRIGIQKHEIRKIVSKELKVLFFLPFILGIFIGSFYIYFLPVGVQKGYVALRYSVLIGSIYMILQILYYTIYQRLYIRKLFLCIVNTK